MGRVMGTLRDYVRDMGQLVAKYMMSQAIEFSASHATFRNLIKSIAWAKNVSSRVDDANPFHINSCRKKYENRR